MNLNKQLAVYEPIDSYTATEEPYSRYGFREDAIWKALLVENTGGEGPECLGIWTLVEGFGIDLVIPVK